MVRVVPQLIESGAVEYPYIGIEANPNVTLSDLAIEYPVPVLEGVMITIGRHQLAEGDGPTVAQLAGPVAELPNANQAPIAAPRLPLGLTTIKIVPT